MEEKSLVVDDNSEGSSPEETRRALTKLAGRGYSQLRHILVQLPDEDKPRSSTLARMVTERRHRELLLYLLLVSCWSWLSDRDDPLTAGVWTRALTAQGSLTWSASTLSRSWKHLEDLGLIEHRERKERLVRVAPRREDAQESYTPPGGRTDRWNTYFILPDSSGLMNGSPDSVFLASRFFSWSPRRRAIERSAGSPTTGRTIGTDLNLARCRRGLRTSVTQGFFSLVKKS